MTRPSDEIESIMAKLEKRHAEDLARETRRADFWEASCRASGRDLQKALLEIKRLGGVPVVN